MQFIRQRTASGGREYNVDFLGRQAFANTKRQLQVVVPPRTTGDERRQKLAKLLKVGLLSFKSSPHLLEQFTLAYAGNVRNSSVTPVSDSWNSWVFEIDGDGWIQDKSDPRPGGNPNRKGQIGRPTITAGHSHSPASPAPLFHSPSDDFFSLKSKHSTCVSSRT